MTRWKHSPVFTTKRGKIKVACICGGQSTWLTDMPEAAAWYSQHSGLKERKK